MDFINWWKTANDDDKLRLAELVESTTHYLRQVAQFRSTPSIKLVNKITASLSVITGEQSFFVDDKKNKDINFFITRK